MLGVPASRGQTHAITSARMAAHGRWQAPNHKETADMGLGAKTWPP